MARKITVTFADGSSHVYDNAPDDVSPQEIVDRATREFGKPVKGLDGGRSTIQRAASAVGGAISGAVDTVTDLVTPDEQKPLDRSGAKGLGLGQMGNTGRSLSLPAPVAKVANERGQAVADRINAPASIETDGYLDRQGVKIKQTMAGIGSGIVRAVAADTRDATSILPESFGDYLTQRADNADRYINAQVKGGTEFDDIMKADGVLGKVGTAAAFMAEEIPASLAYVPLLMSGLGTGAVITSQAGNIGQDRADNNGTGPASSMDIAAAAPAAIASTALDKFGFDRMLGGVGKNVVSRIGNAAMGEGLTEGAQSIIEYAGGTLGTEKDFDVNEAGRQAAAGALVGFGAGGAFRGVGEAIDATGRIRARRADDTRTPGPGIVESSQASAAALTPEDLASPLDNADLAAGMAELAKPEAAGQADAALSQAGLPKVGSQVNVTGLPGGGAMSGTIEDVFSDDTGTGVVVRPVGGGKPMREYLDTLNELGVSITAFDPLAEADTIDATLASLASAPAGVPSPLTPADVEASSPAPSGSAPSTGAGGGVKFDMNRYMARIRQVESGGKDNAKAGTSSATGRYQFTDGTWLNTYKAVFGNTGETSEQILAKRTDGAVQDRLMQKLTSDNAAALQAAGLPVNDTTLYLAHFAGIGGARSILKVAPERSVETVLGKKAVAANSFLKGKTAGDVIAWAAKKVGGEGVGGMAPTVPDVPTQWAELPESAPIRSSEAPAPDLPEQPVDEVGFSAMTGKTGMAAGIGEGLRNALLAKIEAGEVNENGQPSAILQAAKLVKDAGVKVDAGMLDRISAGIDSAKSSGDFQTGMRAMVSSIVSQNTAGPQDSGVAPTVEAPKAGGPEATANDSAGSAAGAVTYDADPALDYDSTPRAERVRIMEAAGIGSSMLAGGPKRNSATEFDRLPAPVQQQIANYLRQNGNPAVPFEQDPEGGAEATARVEETSTGKSVAVIGASEAELAAITAAVPKAMGMPRKDGAIVYSKKYADKINAALAGVSKAVTPDTAPAAKPITGLPDGYSLKKETSGIYLARPDGSMVGGYIMPSSSSMTDLGPSVLKIVRNRAKEDMDRRAKMGAKQPDRSAAIIMDPAAGTVKTVPLGAQPAPTKEERAAATAAAAARLSGAMAEATQNTPANSATVDAVEKPTPSKNRLVTDERAAELRERLKAKLNPNQLNSGIDPEIIAIGTELAVYHIEKGARRFQTFASAIAADLGMKVQDLRLYMRGWYNGARDMMEDAGESVAGMDTPDEVAKSMRTLETWANAEPVTEPAPAATEATDPTTAVRDHFLNGGRFATIVEARKFLSEQSGETIRPGTLEAKRADETIEAAIVQAARSIAERNEGNPIAAYRALVDLYERQPNLSVRSSTSVEQQAYSTPVPLAYLASRRAGINQNTTVYEPTAGNGALLIDARATYVTANELNPDRNEQLRLIYRGAKITQEDASAYTPPGGQRDVVIANPPFGPIKDEDGENRIFNMGDGYTTREIDHAISLLALDNMKNGGKAALIVGSINKQISTDKGRADAYNAKAKREFYYRLYNEYNVTDHFTVAGELYAKQGAGWPVDVIVIEGRGKSALPLPAVKPPRVYDSWTALETEVEQSPSVQPATGTTAGSIAGQGTGTTRSDGRGSSGSTSGRPDRLGQSAPTEQPGDVRAGSLDGEPNGGRLDGAQARNDAQSNADNRAGTDRRPPQVKREAVAGENARQVTYQPASGAKSLDTLVPVNMQTAISNALGTLENRVGPVDTYVADRLGFDPKDIATFFSAEQVDALGLAIDNMERGAGFIIGDQTGIGKGRVVAGVIRYALRSGRMPIFVTEKPNLYADMYRDMNDVGIPKMLGRPVDILMTNAAEKVPLNEDGSEELKTGSAAKHNAVLNRVADGDREGVDVLFTTYSQMQSMKGEWTPRQRAIERLAPGSIIIFDESHNAGGQGKGANTRKTKKQKEAEEAGVTAPNRAEFARQIAKLAHGVFFSSATYAKRPDVMDLYASTDMRHAVSDIEKLGDAIAKGGIPMQQVVASMLTESGQYVRRERSFDGVEYRTPAVPVDRASYSQFTGVLRAIQDFQEQHVSDAVEAIADEIRSEAQAVSFDGSIGGAGATSTNFTSVMHNVVEQMLLAMKAAPAAARAVELLQQGKKPVITVANTMGSFIEEYAADNSIGNGQPMPIDFRSLLVRYLDRTREINIKKPFSKEKADKRYITDSELGGAGAQAYYAVREMIDAMDLSAVPVSPVDYIRNEITKAGYRVSEITGRSATLDYSTKTPRYRIRPGKEKSILGRREAITGFNGGSIDAMILNQAGSTGLSLHASATFKDKRTRVMIIAQAERNIDTHMQMLGRIHRTGQVVLPEYDQLVAAVPAEMRPAAVLAKKMASLNANTTGARDSAMTGDDVPDFMNEYGDEIAARMMEEDDALHRRLGEPITGSDNDKEGLKREDAARKVTGRLMLLPLEEQESFYEMFLSEYRDYLAQKEAAGEATLEAKTLDIDAKVLASQQVVEQTEPNTPFGEAVMQEVMDIKRLGKPLQPDQIVSELAAETETTDAVPANDVGLNTLRAKGVRMVEQMAIEQMAAFDAYRRETLDGLDEAKVAANAERLEANIKAFDELTREIYPGATVQLVSSEGDQLRGVVLSVEKKGTTKNPLALGSYRATFAFIEATGRTTIPFSQLRVSNMPESVAARTVYPIRNIDGVPVLQAFSEMQVEAREKRVFLTGNILAAYEHTGNKGQIVNFVDSEGAVRPGLMMRRGWDYAKEMAKRPVAFRTPEQVLAWLEEGETALADSVKIERIGSRLTVTTAAAKSVGGKFFLDKGVLSAIGGDFYKKSTGMVAETSMERGRQVIAALQSAGATFTAKTNLDRAREIVAGGGARQSIPEAAPIVPAAKIAGKTWQERRMAALQWYNRNLVGTTVTTAEGMKVQFTKRSGDKTTTQKGDRLLAAVPAIAQILERGTVVSRAAGSKPGMQEVLWISAPVQLADGVTDIAVMVRRQTNGTYQYSITDREFAPAQTESDGAQSVPTREGSGAMGLNIFEGVPADKSVSATDVAKLSANLQARLESYGIGRKVAVRIVDTLGGAAGEYQNALMKIATDTSQPETFTLDHEVIHALREMGMFNNSEWAILSAKARRETGLMRSIRQRYEAGFKRRGMSGAALEEALIEEAVSDLFARYQRGDYKADGTIARVFKALRQAIEAIANYVQGRGLRTAEGVMQDVAAGQVGARSATLTGDTVKQSLPDVNQDADPAFENEDTEARFQAAKDGLGSGLTMRERMAANMERAWQGLTRHWINLPNEPRFAALQQKLRAIEAAPQTAKERTIRLLDDMVKDFTDADLDLFTRKVILDDLYWDAGNERDLPFGFTRESLMAESARIDAIVEAQPDKKVLNAVMKRKRLNRTIARDLVDAGVLEAEQIKNPAYYRHQVLEYARAQMKMAHGPGKRLRSPKWAKRMGSTLDINANLLEAEFDWLNKALVDIPIAQSIEWLKKSEHNILEDLRKEAKASNRAGVEAKLQEAEDILDNADDMPEAVVAKAGALIEQAKKFRRNIAMGFGHVREALESGDVKYPQRLARAADAVMNGKTDFDAPPFELLAWMLDNNMPGSMGAAMILKAVGQRRSWTKDLLGREYIEPDNAQELVKRLAPSGYTTWQPDEGKLLFTVKTIPEHVIDNMLAQIDAPAGIDGDALRAAFEGTRNALALGGDRYTMILPEEVAATLNQLRREEVETIITHLVRDPVRLWKRWILINPRRFLKYNINNLTGDLDAVIAGNPALLKRVGVAGRELYRVMKLKEKPSARYEEAVERGVFDSGLSVQEIPDIHTMEPFERFAAKPGAVNKYTIMPLRKAWAALQGTTQWRENVFRYAAYLDYIERIEAGEAQSSIGYGASRPDMVNAVSDTKDRAALLARDLIGDYGAISHYGGWLRETFLPFWSWTEINTKRYWRLTANAYSQGAGKGIATGGALAVSKGSALSVGLVARMAVLYGAIALWNGLFFGDEEDDLTEDQKRQMHLILGRNEAGEVVTLRLQGALSDALSWFGWRDAMAAAKEYELGRRPLSDVVTSVIKTPVNKIATSLSPSISVPIESATGKKLWPDVFNPRPLDDGWRNMWSTFSLDNEYDAVMNRPSRGYGRSWQEAVIYRRDPGEMAYNASRGIVFDWLEREKGQESSGGFSTPRSAAMKDFRKSRTFGDADSEVDAWNRMADLGVTTGDLKSMVKRADPLGPIAKKDRQAFVDQLTDEEYQTFLRADAWYRKTFEPELYRGGGE